MASFIASHRYPGRRTPRQLLERLRAAPVGTAGELEIDAKRLVVVRLVQTLRTIVASIKHLTKIIEHAVAQIPTGRIIMSFPRAGRVNAAQILSELGEDPGRYGSESNLASVAGVAPVTFSSGKKRGVAFRRAANKRFRVAVTTWADNSRHSSPWARSIYSAARQRGKDHAHAVRILARAWIRVLWRCWNNGAEYDASKHGRARGFLPPDAVG